MSSNVVFNVKPMARVFLANTRDRIAAPKNPMSSYQGGRTQDRLPTPMRPSAPSRGPVVTSVASTSKGAK